MLKDKIPKNSEFDYRGRAAFYISETEKAVYSFGYIIFLLLSFAEFLFFFRKALSNYGSIDMLFFILICLIIFPIFVFQTIRMFYGRRKWDYNKHIKKILREDKKFLFSLYNFLLVNTTFITYFFFLSDLNANFWAKLLRFILSIIIVPLLYFLISDGIYIYFDEKQRIEEEPRKVPKEWLH